MSKLSAFVRSTRVSIENIHPSVRFCTRSGAVALTVALIAQASIYYGNQQHLKRAYAVHAQQATPRTPNGGATGTPGVITFDVLGASTVSMQGTIPVGVDSAGDVAGVFIDTGSVRHGFVRAAGGTISTFDAPGAAIKQTSFSAVGTVPLSMDSAGDIAGFYIDANSVIHGFTRTAGGTFTTFDGPGASQQFGLGTIATGVNAAGVATGYFLDGTTFMTHGFVRSASGTFTSFDAPGAVFQNSFTGTQPFSINAGGDVTGIYTDANRMRHGFVRLANGTLTQFDVPGDALGTNTSKAARGTIALGIDTGGDISGVYSDANNLSHGFVRTANGTFTSFDAPGAGTSASAFVGIALLLPGTGGVGINTGGAITGAYEDASSVAHGFVRIADGTITSFDAPGAGTGTGGYQGTAGASINATGTVAGVYLDENSVFHGFVYTGTTVSVAPATSSITTVQTLSVTITVSGKSTTATGTVTLSSGTYTSGATTLSGGSATIVIPAGSLATGNDTLTATYTPDSASSSTYGSASGSSSVTVSAPVAAATTLTLSANPTSSTYGQQVALVATLSPFSGLSGNTNGESVTFYNGGVSLGTGTLTSGVASLNVTALPAGPNSLTAVYAGDANFVTSTSNTLSFTVSPVAPTITFAVPNHTYGDAPFTVAATSTSTGAFTYSVMSGPATITGSAVTLTGKGTVVLQASEAAAGNFAAATQTATFTVAGEAQTISFAAPASPVNYGVAPVALSASATSGLGVTFSVLSGPASVSGSTLTITGAGTVVVAADQAGSTTYAAAPEVTRSITVSKIAPALGLTTSASSVLAQTPVTFTATLTSTVGAPTGSVVFMDGSTAIGTVTLSGGVAALNITTLAGGTHSVTAVYSGDSNFTTATSTAVSETVQDFLVTGLATSSSQTVQPGGTASFSLSFSPAGGTTFPGAVTFSATGLPAGATATFTPASIAAGSAGTNVTLAIQTPLTAMLEKPRQPGWGLPLVGLAVLVVPFGGRMRRSGKRLRLFASAMFLLIGAGGMVMLSGCGGNSTSGGGQTTHSYTVTVTATSGALSHTTTVTLVVQ